MYESNGEPEEFTSDTDTKLLANTYNLQGHIFIPQTQPWVKLTAQVLWNSSISKESIVCQPAKSVLNEVCELVKV